MTLEEILKSNLNYQDKESNISALFGFNPPKETLSDFHTSSSIDEYYTGLSEKALSTSFEDYYSIYNDLKGELIDYGSGYSKGTLLFESLKGKKCISYEFKRSRVKYTQDLLAKKNFSFNNINEKNLMDGDIPIGDNYLIYLPLGSLFFRLINKLYKERMSAVFYIIESHGDFIDYIESLDHWFKLEKVIPSNSPRHRNGIYKFNFEPNSESENIFYKYISEYNNPYRVSIIKDGIDSEFNLSDSLPIKYNNKLCIEIFTLKRILDHQNILIKKTGLNPYHN